MIEIVLKFLEKFMKILSKFYWKLNDIVEKNLGGDIFEIIWPKKNINKFTKFKKKLTK